MSKINVLDSSVYNKISAGEVVERPASVVKEVVENAIDARANNITIEIKEGGIESIVVVDDGNGIEYDSVKNAFLPHATSKISAADDLNYIYTLGFRGEALASIASVSEVEMLTKTPDDELATLITLNAGEVEKFERCSAPVGTKITVSNLFFNVPARKKFLKKTKQEEHEITAIVQRLILSNPFVSFRYIADGKQIYYSSGKNLEDAIFAVYGISTLQNLLKIEERRNDLTLYGYIGKPSFTKANRTYQTLVVNDRYVQNSNISVAVNKGYETHLMKGQFPFFVIFLKISPERIDVNVHPTKMEIRFENNSEIFTFVYRAISNTILSNQDLFTIDLIDKPINSLNELQKQYEPIKAVQESAFKREMILDDDLFSPFSNNRKMPLFDALHGTELKPENMESIDIALNIREPKSNDTVCDNENTEEAEIDTNTTANQSKDSSYNYDESSDENIEAKENILKPMNENYDGLENGVPYRVKKLNIYDKNDNVVDVKDIKVFDNIDPKEIVETFNFNSMGVSDLSSDLIFEKTDGAPYYDKVIERMRAKNLEIEEKQRGKEIGSKLLMKGYKVVGKIFNTFLFVECGDFVVLIDQHAAHERVIYDGFKKLYESPNKAVQPLLVPYVLELNFQEKSFIEQNIQQFTDLGFVIDEFGDKSYKISAVPLLLGGNFDCKSFFDDILSQYGKELKVKDSLKFNEYLMQKACKSAIKAGNDISESEICYLVDAVIDNKTELFCPHGRPIAIKIERKDVEKWFKRVL